VAVPAATLSVEQVRLDLAEEPELAAPPEGPLGVGFLGPAGCQVLFPCDFREDSGGFLAH